MEAHLGDKTIKRKTKGRHYSESQINVTYGGRKETVISVGSRKGLWGQLAKFYFLPLCLLYNNSLSQHVWFM